MLKHDLGFMKPLLTIFANFTILSIVTQNWQYSKRTESKEPNPRDFIKLNKKCAKEAVTAPQNREYRNTHDARIPFGVIKQKGVALPEENFTYGRANRPSTPINGLIANSYGEYAGSGL